MMSDSCVELRITGEPLFNLSSDVSLIAGMACAACVGTLENHLKQLGGIYNVAINLVLQNGVFKFNKDKVIENALNFALEHERCSYFNFCVLKMLGLLSVLYLHF